MRQKISLQVFFLLLATALLTVSCSKGYESPLSGVHVDDMTFGPELDSQLVPLSNSDVSNVVASTTANWCQAYARSTEHGGELVVNVIFNETYDQRTCTVTVSDAEGGEAMTFHVTQLQNDAILSTQSLYEVPAEGGVVPIVVKTNLSEYDVVLHADWMSRSTRSTTRGLQEVTEYVSVPANEGADVREGYVEFLSQATGASAKVLLRQAASPYIILDRTIDTVGEAGGDITVSVTTNVDYRVEVASQATWLQAGTKTETSANHYTQTLTVSPLPAGIDSRRSVVLFVKPDLSVYQMFTVVQQRSE